MGYADKLGEQARNARAAAEAQRLLNAEMRDQVDLARDQIDLLRQAPGLLDDMRTADLALRRQVANAPPVLFGPDGFPVDAKGGRLPAAPGPVLGPLGAGPALPPRPAVSSGGGGADGGGGGGRSRTVPTTLTSRRGDIRPREWLGAHCTLVKLKVRVFGRKEEVEIRAYDCTNVLGEGAIFELPEDRQSFLPPARSSSGGSVSTSTGSGSTRNPFPDRVNQGPLPSDRVTLPGSASGPTPGERDIRRGITSMEAVLVKIYQAIDRGNRDDGGTILRARGLV